MSIFLSRMISQALRRLVLPGMPGTSRKSTSRIFGFTSVHIRGRLDTELFQHEFRLLVHAARAARLADQRAGFILELRIGNGRADGIGIGVAMPDDHDFVCFFWHRLFPLLGPGLPLFLISFYHSALPAPAKAAPQVYFSTIACAGKVEQTRCGDGFFRLPQSLTDPAKNVSFLPKKTHMEASMKKQFFRILSCCVLLACLCALPAYAQEPCHAAQPAAKEDKVVTDVTGSRPDAQLSLAFLHQRWRAVPPQAPSSPRRMTRIRRRAVVRDHPHQTTTTPNHRHLRHSFVAITNVSDQAIDVGGREPLEAPP